MSSTSDRIVRWMTKSCFVDTKKTRLKIETGFPRYHSSSPNRAAHQITGCTRRILLNGFGYASPKCGSFQGERRASTIPGSLKSWP
jgi:hypothetical protein